MAVSASNALRVRCLFLEHFHKSYSDELELVDSGLFGFRLRFGSVTGFSNLLLRRSLAENQKSSLLIATSFLSML
jgi:hypothetical protein